MELFAVKDLTFAYPGQVPALRNISLTIQEGEMLLIAGGSGSGKTSFLKQLKPQLTPRGNRDGDVCYMGKPIETVEAVRTAQEIGYVFQNPEHQVVTDRVWHEMAFGLENQGMLQADMELRVGEVASYFGIQDWFYKKVEELSGGQKQILNLAAVLAMHPRAILLDEPASQLDPIASRNFLEMVCRIREEMGVTVIMAEHHIDDVYRMADHVAVFDQGELLYLGEGKETAQFLYREGLHYLMPAIPRIYERAEHAQNCTAEAGVSPEPLELPPVTLREGREWLIRYMQKGGICLRGGGKRDQKFSQGEDDLKREAGRWTDVDKRKSVVKLREVYYRYERKSDDVLRHLCCDFAVGECFGILGGNGAGKTTVLKLIGGLLRPYSGRVRVTGKTAYLPQNPQSMFSHDRVVDELQGTADELLNLFRIGHLQDRHPYDLSGGEQQRLSLLILLSSQPDILLLDEPTKGMDEECKQILGEILVRLKEGGKTVIIVSHDIEFAARYMDRCGLLFDGRLAGIKETKQFFMQNQYYTTIARRLTRGILENIVLEDEVTGDV